MFVSQIRRSPGQRQVKSGLCFKVIFYGLGSHGMKITMKNHHLGPNPFGSLFPSIKQSQIQVNIGIHTYIYIHIYIYKYIIYLEPRFDPLFLKVSPLKTKAFEPSRSFFRVIWLEEATWHIFTPFSLGFQGILFDVCLFFQMGWNSTTNQL